MSSNTKNLFLFITLIGLCFLIKCKLDADRTEEASSVQKTESTKSDTAEKIAKNRSKTNEVKSHEPSTETAIEEATTSEKVKEEITPTKKEDQKKLIEKAKNQEPKKKAKKKTPKPMPKIEYEELVWNFGEITEGDIIKKKFKFKNTGNAPLSIIGADASCGCARPTVPFLDIAPGESNEIGITYNSVNKEGDQEPEIIIESNTYPKHTVLRLFGTVKPKSKKEEKPVKPDSTSIKQDSTSKN